MLYRMAPKPLLRQLLIWSSLSIASADGLNLGGQIGDLIPECAQSCFESFIEGNFFTNFCGTSPSLECLCSHQTPDGFTIGEGALECIVAFNQLGVCHGYEAGSSVVNKAYNMCSGQPGALPNVHASLSITLALPPTGTGVVVVITKPATSTTGSASKSRTMPSSTTLITAPPRTSGVTPTSASVTPTSTASTGALDSVSGGLDASLGTAQITGISVGVAGAIALALGAIFIARRIRKRRFPDHDDEGFFPVDEKRSPSASSDGRRGRQSMGAAAAARLSRIFHISPPILWPREETVDRNTIGLAISRPRSEVEFKNIPEIVEPPPTLQRRSSRLLPPKPTRSAKPNLTLNIPPPTSYRPASSQLPQTDRTSTMTNVTGFADLDTEAVETTQIWRPPPSDPLSATTYYVADRWGNWVLSNRSREAEMHQIAGPVELDTYTPLTKSPLERKEEAEKLAAALSAASLVRDSSRQERARASSVYSQGDAVRSSLRPCGDGLNKSNSSGWKGPDRKDSKDSHGSATTMDTSSSSPFGEDSPTDAELGRLSTLSPVMESPRSAHKGRSPVAYPQIPGRFDGATIRLVQPPKRPSFTASPPGQPSPTLGNIMPIRDANSASSAYPSPLNPRRLSKTTTAQPALTSRSGFSPTQSSPPSFPVSPLNIPARSGATQARRPGALSPPRLDTHLTQRPHISSFISPTSAATTSSATSSLLAKRVGSERAAALLLKNDAQKPGAWKRDGQRAGDGLLSPDMAGVSSPRTRLPATPTWQPRLTPTRRGDDLYLNVQ